MPESTYIAVLSLAVFLFSLYGVSSPVGAVTSFVQSLVANPQVSELFRFIFLGTIVETGKTLGEGIRKFALSIFVVKAEFETRDFAYDWVLNYLEHHRVWNESSSFKVIARDASLRPNASSALGKTDGHPDAIYEPAPLTPSFFRWRGYWISVNKTVAGYSHYDTGEEVGGTLSISIWSRKRQILDDFVRAARQFYIDSKVLPRKVDKEKEPSGALMTAVFQQGDLSHDWMLAYLRSTTALENNMAVTISTKQSDLGWGDGAKDTVRYMPAHDTPQRFLFTSPETGKSTWLQVVVTPGQRNWNSHTATGGSITITMHSSDKAVLADLIETAKRLYMRKGISTVTVHLTDNRGEWAKTITKSRRALSTLILPTGIRETIVADARQFLESEEWYSQAGIPHRRGYLLYGEPGTGKSTTIHVLAGELGLEIYFISLASPGVDDYSLAKLISDTPSRCILLIEDIDCAFPSRDEEDEDEEEVPLLDKDGKAIGGRSTPPRSAVTLAGLLNVLDSVSSEEGRLTFATTNHIENLDSALIRAGRMDVKIQYKFADSVQIEEVFKRFYPLNALGDDQQDLQIVDEAYPAYSAAEVNAYAAEFGRAVPAGAFSIAQIQGYLLTKKRNPAGAVEGVEQWLKAQEEEKRALTELKQRRKAERARKLKLARERVQAAAAGLVKPPAADAVEVAAKAAELPFSDGVGETKINGLHSDGE
ncbi:p-loop containing nucleoside triphosphate hydrolase protein [Mycena sanguinolenta]|uniref:p-loop containing nucleoside triphosphate hydrolase protein n=1 Tax=Mycena sanguinolenta TaxID=230812 RepID=A0A8H7CNP8_9AGAR|nr:p-loop containing nucleoside triphosphate hydrolase protein [Mycena sanguinolenta]